MREGGPVRRADLDYRDISPELQRMRGLYRFAAGIAAYGKHVTLQHRQQFVPEAGRRVHDAGADVACAGADEGGDE